MNLKSFNIFYDGVTANTFAITSTSATTVSQWTTNSETAMYLKFNTQSAQKITIDMNSTQESGNEKAIGFLYVGRLTLDFPRIPSSKDYKPEIVPKQIVHKLSDGGQRLHEIDIKYKTKIKFKYIEESFRDSLFNIYKTQSEFGFVAFPTTTSWDENFYEVIWPGKFDFFKYSDNASESGFSGTINLAEVTK
jgi:hypothetical protein